jgi:hypothetical protein
MRIFASQRFKQENKVGDFSLIRAACAYVQVTFILVPRF